MQYLGFPFGPSGKTWPRCIPELFDFISVLIIPKLVSRCSVTVPSTGLVKDNHPVPELKRSLVSKRATPLSLSIKTPSGVF